MNAGCFVQIAGWEIYSAAQPMRVVTAGMPDELRSPTVRYWLTLAALRRHRFEIVQTSQDLKKEAFAL
jgi:hypothetical protein